MRWMSLVTALALVLAFPLVALSDTAQGTSATLTAENGSTASGTATLTFTGPTTLQVVVELSGLDANSVHPGHIHFGTCAGGGPVGFPLTDLKAGADGHGTSTTTINGVSLIPAAGWYVNFHQGPTLKDGPKSVACADVKPGAGLIATGATTVSGTVSAAIGAQNNSGVTGDLSLQLTGASTAQVTINLSGLAAGSVHPAHIHYGTCAGNGPVAYPLPDVVADANGKATLVATVDHLSVIPTTGLFVNVHAGPTLKDGPKSIACADVKPAALTTHGAGSSGGTLPNTGADQLPAMLGGLLLLGGAGLYAVARRRKSK